MEIIILGAGVAGVSSAIALTQKGFKVRIFERHKEEKNIGAGIIAWPNACYVLYQLGILDEISSVSGRPQYMHRFSHTGELFGSVDISLINQQMHYTSLSILRHDLQTILINKLNSLDIRIEYAKTVTDIQPAGSDRTKIHFLDGHTLTADIVIGADGRMASLARQYVNTDNTPCFQNFINWIGVYESEKSVFHEISVSDYWGYGERFGIVPVNDKKAYWAAGMYCAQISTKKPDYYKTELLSLFHAWPDPVARIISGTADNKINKIFVYDHNPIKNWHKHNLILIGDAAHAPLPTSGQGACQALEDAWHLANCLAAFLPDIQQAFKHFTALRYDKTTQIIKAARGLASSIFNPDIAYCIKRNQVNRNSNYKNMAYGMSELWNQCLPL